MKDDLLRGIRAVLTNWHCDWSLTRKYDKEKVGGSPIGPKKVGLFKVSLRGKWGSYG